MERKFNVVMYSLMIAVIALVMSCAGAGTQPGMEEPIKVTDNPAELVNSLNSDVSNARTKQLNVIAPDSFALAERNLNSAKRGLEQGDEISAIIENITRGRAALKTGEETAKVVQTAIPETIEARSLARTAGATKFENDYAAVERDFLDLTRSIEKGNLSWANLNKGKVADKFRELELRAIKEKTLGEVNTLLKDAERAGAKKIVPESYALAQEKLVEADTFISQQRYKTEEMNKKAGEALFQARRIHALMELSEKVQPMKPEQTSLFIEGILHRITEKLAASDMRTESLDLQVDNILGSISALQNDRQFMVEKNKTQQTQIDDMMAKHEMEIGNLTRQIGALEGKTKEEQASKDRLEAEKRAVEERLSAERQFNQLYTEVQNYFTPGEAEVYKQGYQLVIRLKSMRFPVGKAVIMPDNYQLLSKVQRAIRTFSEPDVIIEGHTDSTGSEAVNELLSQQRSEAVSEYLLANRTLTADKILAVGYGSQRPLASNETEEGRAVNRRIDVIIKPAMEGEGVK